MAKSRRILSRSHWISLRSCWILTELTKFASQREGEGNEWQDFGGEVDWTLFLCEKPLTYPPISVPRSEDSSPTVVGVWSNGFRFSPNGLVGADLDTPICIYEKRLTKMLHIGF